MLFIITAYQKNCQAFFLFNYKHLQNMNYIQLLGVEPLWQFSDSSCSWPRNNGVYGFRKRRGDHF